MTDRNTIFLIPHQWQIEVYTLDGELFLSQANSNGEDNDNDVIQVAIENIDRLISALQKAKSEAQG